jgi:hypothetical protein
VGESKLAWEEGVLWWVEDVLEWEDGVLGWESVNLRGRMVGSGCFGVNLRERRMFWCGGGDVLWWEYDVSV